MKGAESVEVTTVSDAGQAQAVFMQGKLVFLRPVEDADADALYRWGNDPELRVLTGSEPDCWDHGYGTEAAHLVMEYAFSSLDLHRLAIGVVGFNERALHWWDKLGFRREGLQRDGYFCGGQYNDFVMMSLLKYEYVAQLVR
jgi:RimJ/RimL family protein N-acetyltransferase